VAASWSSDQEAMFSTIRSLTANLPCKTGQPKFFTNASMHVIYFPPVQLGL